MLSAQVFIKMDHDELGLVRLHKLIGDRAALGVLPSALRGHLKRELLVTAIWFLASRGVLTLHLSKASIVQT